MTRLNWIRRTAGIFGMALLARAGIALAVSAPPLPEVAPVKPVIDDYFGIKVSDPYRYMENLGDPAVQRWFKSQADYSPGRCWIGFRGGMRFWGM